ncbi:multiple epidermal growth factor-like domains protein 11 isoform X2 [Dreissena polymorpha]|uniref:multiple epidermal growth factor-like domains protein 11 isoform X2 n=1 Tax=Dreissena polymorpha TaxID=45954 RepID=UPI00226553EC|nr:multiple epidermal growth factor-like domains protein 11 isoform X2 [Dreissena polymorpha]
MDYFVYSWIFIGNPIQILNSSISVTSKSNPWVDMVADKVNDGRVGGADSCKCCAALERPAWVQLTLDKTYLVEKIIILGRPDIYRQQFDNITLLLGGQDQSLDGVAFTSVNATVKTTILTPPREVYTVRVSGGELTTNTIRHMTICEVMIYRQADCLPGKYGANCSKECHCLAGPCESVTGTCKSAVCKDGWRGPACNKTCNPGTFGTNCSSICHCYENVTCHHTDGTCPNNQCAAGWTNENCSVDEVFIYTSKRPEGQCDRYNNALIAVSSVLEVVVAAVVVVIVVYNRRIHRQSTGGTPANRESSSHTYEDLARKSSNPGHYDCLQMSNIQQAGRS